MQNISKTLKVLQGKIKIKGDVTVWKLLQKKGSEEEKAACLEVAGEVTLLLSILVDKGTLLISAFILLLLHLRQLSETKHNMSL